MNVETLLQHFKTKTAIAKALGLSRAAISKWGDEVPELRIYQLRTKYPQLFLEQVVEHPPSASEQSESAP